jgi:hypothetical protein
MNNVYELMRSLYSEISNSLRSERRNEGEKKEKQKRVTIKNSRRTERNEENTGDVRMT